MIPDAVQVFVAIEVVDLRSGFDRLAGFARERIGLEPSTSALFVFFGRRRVTVPRWREVRNDADSRSPYHERTPAHTDPIASTAPGAGLKSAKRQRDSSDQARAGVGFLDRGWMSDLLAGHTRNGRLTTRYDQPSYRDRVSLPQPYDTSRPTRERNLRSADKEQHRSSECEGQVVGTERLIAGQLIRNPKPNESGTTTIFHYYAGFSSGFVEDVLATLQLNKRATILDPWNGGGTTTEGAARHGFNGIGVDINPATVVIARARLATATDVTKAKQILDRVGPLLGSCRIRATDDDLLCRWLGPKTASEFRRIERTLAKVQGRNGPPEQCAEMLACDALLYVALFRTLRTLIREARTTNPTWFRLQPPARRFGAQRGQVRTLFEACASDLLATAPRQPDHVTVSPPRLLVASSLALELDAGSVDAIISSPPYCTRIDYAIATLPELALLGFDETSVRRLRDSMIGTPTVSGTPSEAPREWGPTCIDTLRRIGAHSSKDSLVYYHKVHWAYFERMARSLRELNRVLVGGGVAVLVVQDSYYKNVHVDLRRILIEMAQAVGWILLHERHFDASHAMSDIHPGIARYRAKTLPRETVLFLRKPHAENDPCRGLSLAHPDRQAVADR